MNSLNMTLSFQYVSNLVQLNWKDIKFLIENKYLTDESAVKYAVKLLDEDTLNSQSIMDLVCLGKDESIYPYIDILSEEEQNVDESTVKDKALYIILNWVFDHKEEYLDPFDIVETIYADFDYPEAISGFIRYMPSNEPSLGSTELNIVRLYEKWNQYLKGKKEFYV